MNILNTGNFFYGATFSRDRKYFFCRKVIYYNLLKRYEIVQSWSEYEDLIKFEEVL